MIALLVDGILPILLSFFSIPFPAISEEMGLSLTKCTACSLHKDCSMRESFFSGLHGQKGVFRFVFALVSPQSPLSLNNIYCFAVTAERKCMILLHFKDVPLMRFYVAPRVVQLCG